MIRTRRARPLPPAFSPIGRPFLCRRCTRSLRSRCLPGAILGAHPLTPVRSPAVLCGRFRRARCSTAPDGPRVLSVPGSNCLRVYTCVVRMCAPRTTDCPDVQLNGNGVVSVFLSEPTLVLSSRGSAYVLVHCL